MLTHIHPSRHPFTCRTRPIFNGTVNPGPESGAAQGPPGAQSSFARTRCYLVRRGVSHLVGRYYPSFIAPTNSCARPNSSPWLRFSIPRGLCRLSSVPAARWSFPTLSLRVFPSMLGPFPRRCARCIYPLLLRHHRPSPSPHGSATRNDPLSDFRVGVISQLQSVLYVQASRFAATQVAPTAVFHTGQLWRLRPSRTQVVTFLCIGYASRPNG
jgi:hypothetical protein